MSIYKNLLEAKKKIGTIAKDSKNPFFKSNYFDINKILAEVEPILQENGLLLLQPIEAEWVKSVIINVEDGEKVSSEMHLPAFTDPQKTGSAITYYRRYTLQSLLGLQAEDDDGNSASESTIDSKDKSEGEEKKWLNQFESDKVTTTRNWNRAIATIKKHGVDEGIKRLRETFKVSRESEQKLKESA